MIPPTPPLPLPRSQSDSRPGRQPGGRARRRSWPVAIAAAVAGTIAVGAAPLEAGAAPTTRPGECALGDPDVTTPPGFLAYLAERPESFSLVVGLGDGAPVGHEVDVERPLASAVKVVHLGAYASAVDAGTLDPDEQVPVADWSAWYLPGTDGGAHEAALTRLGAGPDDTVALDDIVSAMIQESDNAGADYLRHRLGDDALVEAAAAGGWDDFEPPSLIGSAILVLAPDVVDDDDPWAVAQQYASADEAARAEVVDAPPAGIETAPWEAQASFGGTGTAAELFAIHRSLADGSFGPGAELASRHLQWSDAELPGVETLAFKGGSLPGVISDALTVELSDGTIATATFISADMAPEDWAAALPEFAWQQVLLAALVEPAGLDALSCIGVA